MANEENEHQKSPQVIRARPRRASAPGTPPKPAKPQLDDQTRRNILAELRHDLRTPLNAVIGYSEILLEDAEDVTGHEDFISELENIHSAGIKSLELVNSILHPAKIESDQTDFSLETFGVNLRHELRTHSNAIISFTERLLKKGERLRHKSDFTEESIPDIENILSAAGDFLAMIRSTENFSELNTGVTEQAAKTSGISSATVKTGKDNGSAATGDCANLLIVDDNAMNLDLLSRHLERQGHHVTAAENGRQALAMIEEHKFDVVLLDIMMPEMDGYQVLQRLKNHDTWRNIPVIMISALDEMGGVVRCIEMGAEDYLSKPFDPVLLRARIGAVLEKKRLRDKEQLYLKSLEREMEIGRDIQASFLPESLPQIPGWEIAASFYPARQVSGDFYDAFQLSGGQGVGIVIADVCGKGVGAALFMGLFRSLIRAFSDMYYSRTWISLLDDVEAPLDPASTEDENRIMESNHANALKIVVTLTNDYIARNHSKSNMFATLFFGVIDPETGILIYINGGHEPPVIVGPDGVRKRLEPSGPALGMFTEDMLPSNLKFKTGKASIRPGEILVSFTDGITEALGPDGELYTKERLFALLSDPPDSANGLLDHIEESLSKHTAGAEQSDDITLLALRQAQGPGASTSSGALRQLNFCSPKVT